MAKNSPEKPKKKAEKLSASGLMRELVEAELERVENDLRHGPNGTGWKNNESKRPAIEERKALLTEALKSI